MPLYNFKVWFDNSLTLSLSETSCLSTNRFHEALRLFSNRSQMTAKCGKSENVAHEAIAECVTDILTTFQLLIRRGMESICMVEKQ